MKHSFPQRKKLFHVHTQNNPVNNFRFFSMLGMKMIISTPG